MLKLFTNAKALYKIDDKQYAVPMGYLWFQSIKYHKWPNPKTEYTETSGFSIEALLPNLDPYSTENADLFDKRVGHGDIIKIRLSNLRTKKYPLDELIGIWSRSGYFDLQPKSEIEGLLYYRRGRRESDRADVDLYMPSDISVDSFWIECDPADLSPQCKLYDFRAEGEHAIESIFALKYLPIWNHIRQQSTRLVESFSPLKEISN